MLSMVTTKKNACRSSFLVFVALLLLKTSIFAAAVIDEELKCNGYKELCNRPYSNVTMLITHDSYAHGQSVAATQNKDIIEQLNDGIRALKLSPVHVEHDDAVHLCHTACAILDAGPATATLDQIATWLDSNPREVVTIFWNNLYNLDANRLQQAYEQSAAMPFVYQPNNNDSSMAVVGAWPTLEQMIASGHRLVNFVDTFPDTTSTNSTPPWLMQEFSYMFETPYDNTDESAFNCNVDRPRLDADAAKDRMYVVNHFLYGTINLAGVRIELPQRDRAVITNGKLLSDHADMCSSIFGRNPNFIEVDFYDLGDAPRTVARLNGLNFNDTIQHEQHPSATASSDESATTTWELHIETPTDFLDPDFLKDLKSLGDRVSSKMVPHVLIDNAPSNAAAKSRSESFVYIQTFTIVMLGLLFIIH